MNNFRYSVLGLLLASPLGLAADCEAPANPELPDGASSNMEQMLAGQKAVKAFQSANLEYMACLEKDFNAAEAVVNSEDASDDEKAAAQETYQKGVDAYNAAVSKEEEVAGQFNTEIREYKAANPG